MKKVFLALAAVVALAACSKEETIVQQAPEAIGFDTFVDNATRSVVDPSLTTDGLQQSYEGFAVFGYVRSTNDANSAIAPIFTNEKVWYDGAWKYGTTQYWIQGAVYNFAAVAPFSVASDPNNNAEFNHSNGTFNTTLTFTNDGTTDLLYAQPDAITGVASRNDPVALTFRHTLSKVKFSFKNEYNATNTMIQVHDIKVTNAYTSGTATLAETTTDWDVTSAGTGTFEFGAATDDEATTDTKEDATITDTNPIAAAYGYNKTYESQNELLLIPADYRSTKLAVSFMYDIVVDGTPIKSFPVNTTVSVNLLPGNAYDFKATIKPGEPIKFTATVSDWTQNSEQNF